MSWETSGDMVEQYRITNKRHNPQMDELEVAFENDTNGPAISIPFGDYVYLLIDHDTNRTVGLTIVHYSEWLRSAPVGDNRTLDEKLLDLVAEEPY